MTTPEPVTGSVGQQSSLNQEVESKTFGNTVVRMIGSINDDGVFALKIILGLLAGILAFEEICQAYTIGLHYFQEMENYIEWITIACAFVPVS